MSADPPFGAMAPSAQQERFRALARRLPDNYWGRRLASLFLGPAGGRERRAYDVAAFGEARARLHPYDNICEKRVFITPQLWDGAERSALADFIAAQAASDFVFVDVGANAGLYTLYAREEARRRRLAFRALCIEADPEMRRRLAFNLEASGASADAAIAPFAAGARSEMLRFAVDERSRGLSRVASDGALEVEARPLLRLATDAGLSRIDTLKIDIEGQEFAVIEAFLRDAPRALWPRFLILETSHEETERSAKSLVLAAGWRQTLSTKRNLVAAL